MHWMVKSWIHLRVYISSNFYMLSCWWEKCFPDTQWAIQTEMGFIRLCLETLKHNQQWSNTQTDHNKPIGAPPVKQSCSAVCRPCSRAQQPLKHVPYGAVTEQGVSVHIWQTTREREKAITTQKQIELQLEKAVTTWTQIELQLQKERKKLPPKHKLNYN